MRGSCLRATTVGVERHHWRGGLKVRLPGNAVGITDINQYRACPRRFEFGISRHTPAGEHPQSQSASTAYGSAIHEAIAYAESNDATDEQAAQRAFNLYAKWMEPADLTRLQRDLATYRQRDLTGVRTVAVEKELRIPLFAHDGETVYFRGKIDRLYERLDAPGVFLQVDYKSSAHPRSEAEVNEDTQQWAYNLLIHEYYPECVELQQLYDQLSFGVIPLRRKTAVQRAEMRQWLIHQITAILGDEKLAPTINDFCAWCQFVHDCPEVGRATEYAQAQIAALEPGGDAGALERYIGRLEDVEPAIKILKRYADDVRDTLKRLPDDRRADLGYRADTRRETAFSATAKREAHEILGDEFYELVSLTKTAVSGHEHEADVLSLAEERRGALVLRKEKAA